MRINRRSSATRRPLSPSTEKRTQRSPSRRKIRCFSTCSDEFSAPDAQALDQWRRAKRKPGRPRQGKGAKVISVSLEKELLARADRLAKSKKVSRASLIARGLRAVLKAEAAGH